MLVLSVNTVNVVNLHAFRFCLKKKAPHFASYDRRQETLSEQRDDTLVVGEPGETIFTD